MKGTEAHHGGTTTVRQRAEAGTTSVREWAEGGWDAQLGDWGSHRRRALKPAHLLEEGSAEQSRARALGLAPLPGYFCDRKYSTPPRETSGYVSVQSG